MLNIRRKKIERWQVDIATANSGESVEVFSKRVGNSWPVELTRVINDIDGHILANRRLKVMEVTPYFDRKGSRN